MVIFSPRDAGGFERPQDRRQDQAVRDRAGDVANQDAGVLTAAGDLGERPGGDRILEGGLQRGGRVGQRLGVPDGERPDDPVVGQGDGQAGAAVVEGELHLGILPRSASTADLNRIVVNPGEGGWFSSYEPLVKRSAMEYRVTCGCGQSIPVSAGAAGTRVECSCGRVVEVPSLREMRRQSGEPETTNPELLIKRMLLAGELPPGPDCNRCGRSDAALLTVVAECERCRVRRPGRWDWLVIAIFSWPFALLAHLWERRSGEVQIHGRDMILNLPIRLCLACRMEARSRAAIAAMLRAVPAYARLLERYPKAKLARPTEREG